MKLSEIKKELDGLSEINFILPNGSFVPKHFHVTEVGKVTKDFIDCGGTIRNEEVINFQLWENSDTDHRLFPGKLVSIIELSEKVLGLPDSEIEVEYQADTIGKYSLDFDGINFLLVAKQTNCLAPDACGIAPPKVKVNMGDLTNENTCTPGSGCC